MLTRSYQVSTAPMRRDAVVYVYVENDDMIPRLVFTVVTHDGRGVVFDADLGDILAAVVESVRERHVATKDVAAIVEELVRAARDAARALADRCSLPDCQTRLVLRQLDAAVESVAEDKRFLPLTRHG